MSEEIASAGLRTWRTRLVQTTAYEIGGAIMIAPIIAGTTSYRLEESALFLLLLSLVFLIYAFLHNFVFDLVEDRLGYGPASMRSHAWRIVHAISLEVTSIIATLPVIMWLGGFGLWEAIAVDLALSAAFIGYAYIFHLGFDWLFPVNNDGSKLTEKISV